MALEVTRGRCMLPTRHHKKAQIAMAEKRFGAALHDWVAPAFPTAAPMSGRFVTLAPLSAEAHAASLFAANAAQPAMWDYLPYGPFDTQEAYETWMRTATAGQDPQFYALRDHQSQPGQWAGVASYLRITPEIGSIEVGHIALSAQMQRRPAATEAMCLMMARAFAAGYRRYEWKCDALNLPSRRAAQRLGFSYEGTFRQATIVKGRNRDTAWFAVTDQDWPALSRAHAAWLAPENFTPDGQQRQRLSDLTAPHRVSSDPALD